MNLTENDLKNLKIFLARVQVSGIEAETFVELAKKINQIIPITEKEDAKGK